MIITEFYKTRLDGVNLYRTYSNAGFMIERDGVQYDEAIDPENTGRVYTETDIPVEVEDDTPGGDSEAAEILNILLGGEET